MYIGVGGSPPDAVCPLIPTRQQWPLRCGGGVASNSTAPLAPPTEGNVGGLEAGGLTKFLVSPKVS